MPIEQSQALPALEFTNLPDNDKLYFDENTTFVATIQAADTKGGRITYSLKDEIDSQFLQIDPDTGVLSFRQAPDFETPLDESPNHPNPAFDNKYGVTLVATNEFGISTKQTVWVIVNDVEENDTSSALGKIAGQVRNDVDGDGNLADPDAGIAGVTLNLYRDNDGDFQPDGDAIATTTTDANGHYSFDDLADGNYIVEETNLAGFESTADTNGFNPDRIAGLQINGNTIEGQDFLDAPDAPAAPVFPGAIHGQVRNDTDGDGDLNDADSGISGVTIKLFKDDNGDFQPDGEAIATTITGADGKYTFDNLPEGRYVVEQVNLEGFESTADANGYNPDRVAGIKVTDHIVCDIDFLDTTETPTGSISGQVRNDVDGDGDLSDPDAGIAGVTIQLFADNDGNYVEDGAAIATTTTDVNGNYAFEGLADGKYIVREVNLDGFESTADVNGFNPDKIATLTIKEGKSITGQDFLDTDPNATPASLGDRVWLDTDKDGIQDANESGVADITVTLTGGGEDGVIGTADDTTATTTTDGNGNYAFEQLNPGEEYKLTFELPDNVFEFTPANNGNDDAVDSDVDPSTGMTQIVTLAPGENNSTLDAGIQKNEIDLSINKEVTNVTAGSRWSAIGYSDDIAYPLDIMRYDITVTNHSDQTATGIVVEDTVPENFDIAQPGQTVSDMGMGWNTSGRAFDSRVWWGRAYQGSVDVIDSTNGTVAMVDPGTAPQGLTLAPGQSYGLPEGSVTWELGDTLAPGESATLSYFGVREVYSGYNWNTGTQFFTEASIAEVDQHDINPNNNSDSARSWWISPIAIDLHGDGIQTLSIDKGVKFDMLNTGEAVNTGWLSGDDGFLAIDNDGDGLISSRAELFGGGVGDGFAKLKSFDSNGDGLVNESDIQFSELKLWQDANENGVTDQGELMSLDSVGITNLNTTYTNVFSTDANGNIHGEVSSAVKHGNTVDMVDVYFQVG